MYIKRNQWPILIVNFIFLVIFAFIFFSRRNYEFILYIGVIILFLILVILTNKKIDYPNYVLWGLTVWGFLHLSGGGILINGRSLYEFIIVNLSETYSIFKYDQFVHIVGFGVATLVMYHLISRLVKNVWGNPVILSIIVLMAGLGVGALNEIIEFLVTVIVPETGVGGYTNTSLDLVADLMGAVIALIFIRIKERV